MHEAASAASWASFFTRTYVTSIGFRSPVRFFKEQKRSAQTQIRRASRQAASRTRHYALCVPLCLLE